MTIRQIVSVMSKLFLQTKKSQRRHQKMQNEPFKESTKGFTPSNGPVQEKEYFAGGTLIVLRGKEDIAQWEVALREYTSLSVLNHSALQSNSRKHANMALKCAGFDVVLTTYDSIKSKEVTIPVDSDGCAILQSKLEAGRRKIDGNGDDGGGWFTSRTSGTQSGRSHPQQCHQLSILHRMSWYRVVLMDVLGRKGFLTKAGTARAQAAIALNSQSR